jgi:AcrR family transcriptional regulator
MAAPVGLDRDDVVAAGAQLLREAGRLDGVSLRDVASLLGVRVQSLYSHVNGLDGLRHELALRGLDALAQRLALAAVGKAGADALDAIVRAYLGFAAEQSGLYEASLRPPGDSAELHDAMEAVMRPLNIVFETYGLEPGAAIHWYRIVFAAIHGFALLRRDGLITLPGDINETLDRFVAALVRQIEREVNERGGRRSRRATAQR